MTIREWFFLGLFANTYIYQTDMPLEQLRAKIQARIGRSGSLFWPISGMLDEDRFVLASWFTNNSAARLTGRIYVNETGRGEVEIEVLPLIWSWVFVVAFGVITPLTAYKESVIWLITPINLGVIISIAKFSKERLKNDFEQKMDFPDVPATAHRFKIRWWLWS